ncbi:AraC family transcriptional regulator [Halalkalibacter sp. APA_J-10(15)]|uniref:AraC family transcriptional regulator n=1 Tax=unclassified Halalkalibacter TaxID=2893063 RepID=UPI001FF30938|nr:helix-turn-helix domain-containing protein [Halalkalibacter sp. APA_J-10(15)]MCK0472818.1 helix-turn-helix domain-containing protein [Halalkalibacter sp. APA_J-10(15)]
MNRLPLMLQLIVILFCIMAIPIAILTWYSGEQIVQNSEYAIAESSLAELNANRMLSNNALNHIAQNTVALTSTNIFDRIHSYKNFTELNSNLKHVLEARVVLGELMQLKRRGDGVYSVFFYLSDSDYVVSTDKGITNLEKYEPIDWIQEALVERRGIRGVWYSRELESGVNVISYVLPLNQLSTITNGTIVVNVTEVEFGNYFRSSDASKQEYAIMDSNGTIISHSDKSMLLEKGTDDPFIREIFEHDLLEGYMFRELEGERMLYTWSRTKKSDWINVGVYSVNELMMTTHSLQRNIILLTVFIILIGVILTVFLATWLSKPIRDLVQSLSLRTNLGINGRNELAFLDVAFNKMQEKEEDLQRMLNIRERDSHSLAIHNLLRGEISSHSIEMFAAPCFLLVVVSIDQYRDYVNIHNPETRSYHCYHFTSECNRLFPESVTARCVYQGDGCFVIVLNYEQLEDDEFDSNIHMSLLNIMNKAEELLSHSVTIGVSSPTKKLDLVSARFAEAMEVIKHRMIKGSGGITYWSKKKEHNKKYIYPVNSERRILNFMDNGDLDSIISELGVISNEIRSADYISYDNILFIYHQLVGICIKHLRENNISTTRIFAGRDNIYTSLTLVDTLDEIEKCLVRFFEDIMQYLTKPAVQTNDYGESILSYLDHHYCEEIDFEEMAEDIGISYSYMRRIVYEMTGRSLIEHLNIRRIEKAKQMLVESNLTIAQIASTVGYNNAQSFNRFFRKFEGMTPSNYKQVKS